MQLKITTSKGRETVTEPGVTLRITGAKLSEKSMREEVSKTIAKVVPRAVEKIIGEQLELVVESEEGKKGRKKSSEGEDNDDESP